MKIWRRKMPKADRIAVRRQQVKYLIVSPRPHMFRVGNFIVVRTRQNKASTSSQEAHRFCYDALRLVEVFQNLAHGNYIKFALD